MSFLSSVGGQLHLEITCADPERLLQELSEASITIHRIQRLSDLTINMTIYQKQYRHLCRICDHMGAKQKILRRSGLYWYGKSAIARPVMIAGLGLGLLLCLFLPTRVLFVTVQGNADIPARQIQNAAQDCGIGFGASRREVRSEKAKNTLLSRMPELEWVGINTSGCVAEISVRERTSQTEEKSEHHVTHIVAAKDGYLLSMTVTSGNPLCAPGQQVKKGQVLVSGYTDCGLFIQAGNSEAEILAQTNRHLEVITPAQGRLRLSQTGHKRKYSLLIGKKRINLWKGSGIPDTSCGRIYEEKYATLPGGFRLPLALCIENHIFYDETTTSTTEEAPLSSFAETYLVQQMLGGSILSKEESIATGDGVHHLTGDYTCQEMIGRVKPEQIGDFYGKIH